MYFAMAHDLQLAFEPIWWRPFWKANAAPSVNDALRLRRCGAQRPSGEGGASGRPGASSTGAFDEVARNLAGMAEATPAASALQVRKPRRSSKRL